MGENYYQAARQRAKRVKSPWNLLLFPITLSVAAAVVWLLLHLVLKTIVILGVNHPSLKSYASEDVRSFILIPLFFVAFPIGLTVANLVFWLIPPLRRIEDQEAKGYPGTDYLSSQRGLVKIILVLLPLGLLGSFLVAYFGK